MGERLANNNELRNIMYILLQKLKVESTSQCVSTCIFYDTICLFLYSHY